MLLGLFHRSYPQSAHRVTGGYNGMKPAVLRGHAIDTVIFVGIKRPPKRYIRCVRGLALHEQPCHNLSGAIAARCTVVPEHCTGIGSPVRFGRGGILNVYKN